jgi:hypothetical protein
MPTSAVTAESRTARVADARRSLQWKAHRAAAKRGGGLAIVVSETDKDARLAGIGRGTSGRTRITGILHADMDASYSGVHVQVLAGVPPPAGAAFEWIESEGILEKNLAHSRPDSCFVRAEMAAVKQGCERRCGAGNQGVHGQCRG